MTVWIVMGTTGEYSDHTVWTVKGFLSQRRAEVFALAAKQEADRLIAESGERYISHGEAKHSLDPDFRSDYTGTDYYVTRPVEIDEDAT